MLCLCSCAAPKNESEPPPLKETREVVMKAAWISCYELQSAAEGADAEGFRENITHMFENLKSSGINTVIVHARAYADSFYPSELFPWSRFITGEQGKNPGYDPFGIALEQAHGLGLEFHAWINPYRVLYSCDFSQLSPDNPAAIWNSDDNTENDRRLIVIDSGIFFNPCEGEVQRLIIEGVREIIRNYDVDAIHLDDYFYPSTDPEIDSLQYGEYTAAGGKASLAQWRRENVNAFLAGLYATIKLENPEIELGISPAGGIEDNYNTHYADVRLWTLLEGFTDYLMPQIYYGFEHSTKPFEETCDEWAQLAEGSHVKLICGLAFYKSGTTDTYAGDGSEEWKENSDIIARQAQYVAQSGNFDGIALFSYSYMFNEETKEELANFIKAMGDSE